MSFLTKRLSLTTTRTKFADAAAWDRVVLITAMGANDLRLAFDNSGDEAAVLTSGTWQMPVRIELPAGRELWLRDNSGASTIDVIITR